MMRKILYLLFCFCTCLLAVSGFSQEVLTIQQCHAKAIELSPLQKQKLYFQSITQLNTESYQSINYPHLMLNAQATYQSDVFSLPFQVPGIESPIIPQEQYKVAIDFYQNIYNGGQSKSAQIIEDAKMQVDIQAVEINFQQVREIINSLFFGTLKAQEQIELLENVQKDLDSQKAILQAMVDEGAAISISVKVLEKEIISLEQQLIEVESARSSLLEMLGKWIEQSLTADVVLQLPESNMNVGSLDLNRAESKQFQLQMELLESRQSQLAASRIPDIGLFGTAGLGYPNPLNWFDVEFTPYWLAGIKLSWNILDYGKASRDKEVLAFQQQNILAAQENFERSVEITTTKQYSEISKYEKLIEKDQQIVKLQEEIVAVASSQLQNGVINSNDYVLEVNRGLNANISLKMHQIDLEKTRIELLTLTGNTDKL